ncbi:glutaredoxin family protein [Labrys monachus]|uniref:Glutaredoxin n=1 Tax=Labrys monachus TaxID=217067 RepID=A0ABU0FGA4_9HYPH|nr:glutaredoxin domain-containing protein [Labrys monachus]MDQ0393628.1 glutaredoxin [Labrys monachus]
MHIDPIRVFWVPGCSACVKAKEFLTSLGVPFESVNLLENEQGAADLAALGARSLPVIARGGDFVFAQSLDQVAKFLGREHTGADRLSPEMLVRRWADFLGLASSLVADMPGELLEHRPIPRRDRTMRELAYHIYQIPDVFVRNVAGEFEDWAHHVNLPVPDAVRTTGDILAFGGRASAAMIGWWEGLDDRACLWTVQTYYGARPAWELLERQTWHSAQHVRQLEAVLQGFAVPLARTAPPRLYEGLPLPAGLWA